MDIAANKTIAVTHTQFQIYRHIQTCGPMKLDYSAIEAALAQAVPGITRMSIAQNVGSMKRVGAIKRYEVKGVKHVAVEDNVTVGVVGEDVPTDTASQDTSPVTPPPKPAPAPIQPTPPTVPTASALDASLDKLAMVLRGQPLPAFAHLSLKRQVLQRLAEILYPDIGVVLTDIDGILALIEQQQASHE